MESIPAVPVPVAPAVPDRKGLAIASFVLGLICLCMAWFPFISIVGLIGAIVGLVLGIRGLKSSLKGLAIAGIVLCGIALLGSLIFGVIISTLLVLGPVIGNVFTEIESSIVVP